MAQKNTRTRRGWIVPATVAAAALVASLSIGALGAYSATITNDANTAGTGSLTMSETGPGANGHPVTYDTKSSAGNTITATSINKYGGNQAMVPGQTVTTTVTFTNTGSVPATAFQLDAAAATVTGPDAGEASLADTMIVKITAGGKVLFEGTPSARQRRRLSP